MDDRSLISERLQANKELTYAINPILAVSASVESKYAIYPEHVRASHNPTSLSNSRNPNSDNSKHNGSRV